MRNAAISRIHNSELLGSALHLRATKVPSLLNRGASSRFHSYLWPDLSTHRIVVHINHNFGPEHRLNTLVQCLVIQSPLVGELLTESWIDPVHHDLGQFVQPSLGLAVWKVGEIRIRVGLLDRHVLVLE